MKWTVNFISEDGKNRRKSIVVEAASMEQALSKEIPGWFSVSAIQKAQVNISSLGTKKTLFSQAETIRFCRGMASMLKAGISTVDALQFYAANLPSKVLQGVIKNVIKSLQEGAQPHDAFKRTDAFDSMFVGIVKAGSTAGDLASALNNFAKLQEVQVSFKSRIRRLLITPVIVMAILIVLFIASQLTIAPKIQEMLTSNNVAPDSFTAATFALSASVRAGWLPSLAIAIAVGCIIAFNHSVRTTLIDLIMNKWRLLRNMIMGSRQYSFIGTMSLLQRSQVKMEECLGVCAEVMQKTPMGAEISEARSRYMTGLEVSECLKQFTSCDSTIIHMVAIGEKTGSVPDQLALCTTMLEDQTKNTMDDFSAVVSFISTAVPVFMIGLIFLTSYLPIVLMSARLMQRFSGD